MINKTSYFLIFTSVLLFSATTASADTAIYPNKYVEVEDGVVKHHIYLGDQVIATVERDNEGTETYYTHTDHLGSSAVVTDESGQVEQILDYYPYGSTRIEEQSGSFYQTKRYTGHEYDEDTNYTYAGARYLNTDVGRFISQDPVFWTFHEDYLVDPQQWNSYSYARNNPVVLFDPTGLKTIIIPGTYYDKGEWTYEGAAADFIASVGATFNETPDILYWSDDNSKNARFEAMDLLAKEIGEHEFKEGEKLNIVGFSHGGNIAALFSNLGDRKIDNLVTLGTPARSDYNINYDMVGNHTNAYSNLDPAQIFGGQAFAKGGIGLSTGYGLPVFTPGLSASYGFKPAGRKFDGAENINVTLQAGLNPVFSHSNLWQNPPVWSKVNKLISK